MAEAAFLVFVGIVALGFLLFLAVRYPLAVVGLWFAIGVAYALNIRLSSNLGPFTVQVADLAVLLSLAAIASVLRSTTRPPIALLLLVGWVLVLLLLRSVPTEGAQLAVNEARRVGHFVAAAALVAAVRPTVNQFVAILTWTARVLIVIAIVRFIQLGSIGSSDVIADPVTGDPTDQRLLPSAGALLIGEAVLLSIVGRSQARLKLIEVFVGIAVIVALQQRTVWVSITIAVLVAALCDADLRARASTAARSALTPFVAVMLAAVAVVALALYGHALGEAIQEPFDPDSTFNFRLELWGAVLGTLRGFVSWMIGNPFGSGYEVFLRQQYFEVSPHSLYVELIARTGLVGLGLYLASLLSGIRPGEAIGVRVGIVVTLLIYSMTYTPNPEQGLLLGLAIAVATPAASALRAREGNERAQLWQ